MKCKDIQELIEEYRQNKDENASIIHSHMEDCAECRRFHESMEAEEKIYRAYGESLSRQIDIGPSLWHELLARLRAQANRKQGALSSFLQAGAGRFNWQAVMRQAIFAVIVAVLSVTGTLVAVRYYQVQEPGSISDKMENRLDDPGKNAPDSLDGALQSIRQAEAEYLSAIHVLSDIVDRSKPALEPGIAAKYKLNIDAADEKIAFARMAYHAHPNDPELAFNMLMAYERKVDLLLEIAS